jgi:hypothetical protein
MSVMFDFHLAGPYTPPPRPVLARRRPLLLRAANSVVAYIAALVEATTYLTVFIGVAGGFIWLGYFAYLARR